MLCLARSPCLWPPGLTKCYMYLLCNTWFVKSVSYSTVYISHSTVYNISYSTVYNISYSTVYIYNISYSTVYNISYSTVYNISYNTVYNIFSKS